MDQLHGVNVKDILGLRVVTEFLMVPGETEYVPDAERIDPEDIASFIPINVRGF